MRQTWHSLRETPLTAIYSSPVRRAIESAREADTHSPLATVDERLREIDFGEFEGLTYDEIARLYPEKYDEWMTRPTEVTFPDGESFTAMAARVHEAMDHIRGIHSGETVAIVSHGGVNRIALATALELDPRRIFRLDQAYACVNVIDYIRGEPLVRLVNAVARVPC